MGNCFAALTWIFCIALLGCAGNPSPADSPNPGDQTFVPEATTSPVAPSPAATPSDSPPPAEPLTAQTDDLWSRLQQAETRYFVLMRHALAPGTGDPATFRLGDCSTQRNLNEAGREQAQRTGEAFRQRDIPVSQVLSSQWCRCLETAELLDLGAVDPFPPLNSFFQDRSTADAQTQQVREFMLNYAEAPGVTVMVTHFVNISALSGSGVSSGEMVVMQVNDQDEVEVVGQLEALY